MRGSLLSLAAVALAATASVWSPAVRAGTLQAQEPAIVAYGSDLTQGGYWIEPPFAGSIGFVFRPAGSIAATGLTFFNPTGVQAGGFGRTPATSYTVSLMQLTQVRFDFFSGDVIAQATVSAASQARDAPTGPSGVFWTTPLGAAVQLSAGTVYGVFAAPNDGGYAWYAADHISKPNTPAVVGWIADAGELGGEVFRSDATSGTGPSFAFIQTVPEPETAWLVAPAALALAWLGRRRSAVRG